MHVAGELTGAVDTADFREIDFYPRMPDKGGITLFQHARRILEDEVA